jgi:hypothetical protein
VAAANALDTLSTYLAGNASVATINPQNFRKLRRLTLPKGRSTCGSGFCVVMLTSYKLIFASPYKANT